MKLYKVCATCGTYYPSAQSPELCTICLDERQYIPATGQSWTTPEAIRSKHCVKINKLQKGLYELEVNPEFAIGQRALLVLSEKGNVLWDCIPLLDEQAITFIQSKGGLNAIALSHPHYYSNMNEWGETFNCPVYTHEYNAMHIVDNGKQISLWKGRDLDLWDGIKVKLIGGHFDGSCILYVPALSENGTVLCGDTLYISPSKQHMAVMYSYPNRIPLPITEVNRVGERFLEITFDSIYGFYSYQNVLGNAEGILQRSLARYS